MGEFTQSGQTEPGFSNDVHQQAQSSDARFSGARFSEHLNESDAILWSIERDPILRTTIVAIALLDTAPDWKRLRSTVSTLSDQIPRLHQKVEEPPLRLNPPRWVDDRHFELDYHLRRINAPEPKDLSTVLEIASHMAMDAFDKDRPLWEFTLVEGLADGTAAFIQKVHHSFTDGVGGVKLAELFLDDDPEGSARSLPAAAPDAHRPTRRDTARPSGIGVVTEAVGDSLRSAASLSQRSTRALPHLVVSAVTNPVGAVRGTAKTMRSVGKLLRPARAPLSPVMTQRGLSRRLQVLDLPLDDMLAAAHRADATLNDAFLAGIAGGMRRYHDHHGATPSRLRVTMPVNLRRADDELGNNKFTPVRFSLPISTIDAAERMRELGAITRSWRKEPALPLTELLAGGLNRMPVEFTTSFFGAMLKSIDFVATNVPGLPARRFLAGAEVLREYAFAPPSGSAFSLALMSHVDRCCLGLNIDTAAIADTELLVSCIREGFDEVLQLLEPIN
jgi:diacylglycerol O-acyltransferase